MLDTLTIDHLIDFYESHFKNGRLTLKLKTVSEYLASDESSKKEKAIQALPELARAT